MHGPGAAYAGGEHLITTLCIRSAPGTQGIVIDGADLKQSTALASRSRPRRAPHLRCRYRTPQVLDEPAHAGLVRGERALQRIAAGVPLLHALDDTLVVHASLPRHAMVQV